MEKNTCWFFGDSFTQCLALKVGSDYSKWKGIDKDIPSWTNQVSEYLGMDEVVIARGGRASSNILTKVLENVENFKKGDWVIVTDSPYVRTEGIDFRTNEITTYNNEQFLYSSEDSRFDEGNEVTHGIPIPIEKSINLVDYISDFILPFQKEWESHWENNLINLTKLLKLSGINSLFWSQTNWHKFESITRETNSEILDDHWGKNGSDNFAKYMIKNIQNKNYILNDKSVSWNKTMI